MCRNLLYLAFVVLMPGLAAMDVVTAAEPGLVGWWRLDDGSGTIAKDSSGNGNDGTINGAETTEGQIGEALLFDEVDDRVVVPDFAYGPDFTVAFWFKSSGNAGTVYQYMYSHAPYDASNSLNIYFCENSEASAGTLRTALKDVDDPTNNIDVPAGFADGNWHYYTLTVRTGVGANIYVDAVSQVSSASQGGDAFDPASDLYFGARVDLNGQRFFGGALDEVRVYDRMLPEQEIAQAMIGIPRGIASEPSPADEATDVPRDVVLSWTLGEFAPAVNGHRVYLSDSFADVNDGVGGISLSDASYALPQGLAFGTTYYWRVDEVNAPPDLTVFPGVVWSFTTEPVGYPIDSANIVATASSVGQADVGPENTINGSGLDENDLHSTTATDMWLSGNEPQGAWIQYEFDKVYKLHQMWVWNSNQIFEALYGFGLKDVTVEYSTNGTEWTAVTDVLEFAQAPGSEDYAHSTTVDFGGAVAKYVKLTATSNWGGLLPQYGLSEIRFFSIPVSAREPSPEPGAVDVSPEVTLSWRAGREVARHNVYVSDDEQAVIDGTAAAVSVTEAGYSTALNLNSTYYWRVDEVNDAETPTTWQGDVWSFSTLKYLVVEDFEDYNDWPPYEIYTTWVDGYENPINGSQVGYLTPPTVETTIVHDGDQSMPLIYSNRDGAMYSEAERTFGVPQDWTRYGIKTLGLWFYGTSDNTGQLYIRIDDVKVPYDGDAGNLAIPAWQSWNIDLIALSVNLRNVTKLTIGIEDNNAAGTLYVDDIRLYAYSAVPTPAVIAGHWTLDDGAAVDSSGNGNNGTVDGAQATEGRIGGALLFDEVDDLVVVPDFLYGPEFSVAFWFKSSSNDGTAWQYMFSHAPFDASNSLNIYFGENGNSSHPGMIRTMLRDSDDPGASAALDVDTGFADGNWHHYGLTISAAQGATVYIDGALQKTESSRGGDAYDPESDLYLGARVDRNAQRFFGGALDDVRVYNGVFTAEEVTALAGTP